MEEFSSSGRESEWMMKQIVVEPAQKLLRVVDAAFIGADDADRDERSSERLLRIAQ